MTSCRVRDIPLSFSQWDRRRRFRFSGGGAGAGRLQAHGHRARLRQDGWYPLGAGGPGGSGAVPGRTDGCARPGLVAGLRPDGRTVVPVRSQVGRVADRTPEIEGHPPDHHRPRPGSRGGRPGQRTQPARGRRAEPGERRRHHGRDADRGALVLARHAGALRAGPTRETGRRGEAALRPVRQAAVAGTARGEVHFPSRAPVRLHGASIGRTNVP